MKLRALTGVESFPSLRLSENLAEAEFLAIHPHPYRWGIPRRRVKLSSIPKYPILNKVYLMIIALSMDFVAFL
ncbi:MAG: hypothetical protein V1933_00635 [Candidatus Omnitrophota bacterium]